MALQLSGSIDVIGGFNTTEGGTYSGSGFYEDIFLSGSVYDSDNIAGQADQVLTLNSNGKVKWRNGNSIKDNPADNTVYASEFDYYLTWEGGLDFSGSAVSIPINGESYSIDETVINLDAADATNPRFDIIVATTGSNNVGTFDVIKGTPAVSPFYPRYDEGKQIPLKYILVRSNATDAADGGDGTADNNDGTNDVGDGTDGNYPDFEARVLFDENPDDYNTEYKATTYRFYDSRLKSVRDYSKIFSYAPNAYNGDKSITFYTNRKYWELGGQMPVVDLAAKSTSTTNITGRFDFNRLENITLYIKANQAFPAHYQFYLWVDLITPRLQNQWQSSSSAWYGIGSGGDFSHILTLPPTQLEAQTYWADTSYKKIVIPKERFAQSVYYKKNGGSTEIIGVRIRYSTVTGRPGSVTRTAAQTVADGNYTLLFDKIVANIGGVTPSNIVNTELDQQKPLFDFSYGSPTIKTLKVNALGNQLTGNYSNILGGSHNILSGSSSILFVSASQPSGSFTGSVEIVDGPEYSSILGGYKNLISGSLTGSVVLGGFNNKVTSNYSTIVGGSANTSSYDNTFILGSNLTADKANYTFVNNLDIEGTVSASIFSGSFVGDGSGLTGISGGGGGTVDTSGTPAAGRLAVFTDSDTITGYSGLTWDDSFDDSKLTVSGYLVPDITIGEGIISASIFSGSFVGDGSGLTGISGGGGGGDYSPFTTGSINSTGILPTLGNNSLIVGANATVAGGTFNTGSGQCTFIGGGQLNYASTQHGAVVAGCKNKALSPESAVVGGHDNHACANQGFIGAGRCNTVEGFTGGIVSGDSNCISSAVNYSFIGGGTLNTASAHCSAILGGDRNYISSSLNNSFIVGSDITADKACYTFMNNLDVEGTVSASIFSGSFVGDGSGLTGIGGGGGGGDYSPYITGSVSTGILPTEGSNCTTIGAFTTIAGGTSNTGSGERGFIGGGNVNFIASSAVLSVIGGGEYNQDIGGYNVIGGGSGNIIGELPGNDTYSFIGGGSDNIVTGSYQVLAGGLSNRMTNVDGYSVIGGGTSNTVSGDYSGILGGSSNNINGHNDSFIIGSNLTSTTTCYTFVNNLCNVGGGTSDCRLKENIQPLTYGLCQLVQLDPVSYNFISDESSKTKYGFLAQCVQEVIPDLIYHHPTDTVDGDPVLQFDKEAIWSSMINAIKEQQEKIDNLEARIAALEG